MPRGGAAHTACARVHEHLTRDSECAWPSAARAVHFKGNLKPWHLESKCTALPHARAIDGRTVRRMVVFIPQGGAPGSMPVDAAALAAAHAWARGFAPNGTPLAALQTPAHMSPGLSAGGSAVGSAGASAEALTNNSSLGVPAALGAPAAFGVPVAWRGLLRQMDVPVTARVRWENATGRCVVSAADFPEPAGGEKMQDGEPGVEGGLGQQPPERVRTNGLHGAGGGRGRQLMVRWAALGGAGVAPVPRACCNTPSLLRLEWLRQLPGYRLEALRTNTSRRALCLRTREREAEDDARLCNAPTAIRYRTALGSTVCLDGRVCNYTTPHGAPGTNISMQGCSARPGGRSECCAGYIERHAETCCELPDRACVLVAANCLRNQTCPPGYGRMSASLTHALALRRWRQQRVDNSCPLSLHDPRACANGIRADVPGMPGFQACLASQCGVALPITGCSRRPGGRHVCCIPCG